MYENYEYLIKYILINKNIVTILFKLIVLN